MIADRVETSDGSRDLEAVVPASVPGSTPQPRIRFDLRQVARAALVVFVIATIIVMVLIAAHAAIDIVLLTYAGLLFGLSVRGVGAWFSRRSGLSVTKSIVICLAVLVVVSTVAGLWIVPHVAAQLPQLGAGIVKGSDALRDTLESSKIGRDILGHASSVTEYVANHMALAVNVAGSAIAVLGAFVYVVFVGLYYAFSPEMYRRGVIALVPPRRRARAGEVLDTVGTTLRRWVLARVTTMTCLGLATMLGLGIAGIPLAVTLGFLAGILLFIPYLGALASAIPALLIAATLSWYHVLYVGLIYVGAHLVEGYLLSPFLEKRAVRIPPVVLLAGQLLAGALWGILGIALATPLLAATVVIVKMLYVEDVLGGTTDATTPGTAPTPAGSPGGAR